MTFTYKLRNGSGPSNTATVTLNVTAAAQTAPTASNFTFTRKMETFGGTSFRIEEVDSTGAVFDQAYQTTVTDAQGAAITTLQSLTVLQSLIVIQGTANTAQTMKVTYRLKNGVGVSNVATVTLVLTPWTQ